MANPSDRRQVPGRHTSGLKKADGSTKSFGATLKSVGKTGALAAGAAGVGALVYTLKIGISEYAESQKVAAQTNAVHQVDRRRGQGHGRAR